MMIMKMRKRTEGVFAGHGSVGAALRIFVCVLLLLASRVAFAQTAGAPTPADDAPDPDALARVQNSDAVTAVTGGFVHRVGDHFEQDGHYFLVKGVNFKLRDAGWDMWGH